MNCKSVINDINIKNDFLSCNYEKFGFIFYNLHDKTAHYVSAQMQEAINTDQDHP